jgi:hypothetical protein
MRLVADPLSGSNGLGSVYHARATNEDGAESSQDFTPSERRFADFCHRKNDMIAGKSAGEANMAAMAACANSACDTAKVIERSSASCCRQDGNKRRTEQAGADLDGHKCRPLSPRKPARRKRPA